MGSFFHRLYKYRESDLRHQKENFLTEIFAYCLINDKQFQTNFLFLIGCGELVNDFECKTQFAVSEMGKPDVHININGKITIIIECKLDTTQQETQLRRYCEILSKNNAGTKHLVLLTKYYEETEDLPKNISFKHIRWFQIFDLLHNSSNEMSKELFNYLIDEKMSTQISFNKNEGNALKTFKATLVKMNEFLIRTKDMLSKYTSLTFRFVKVFENCEYGIMADLINGKLWIGFYQYENNDEMQISISIEDVPITSPKFKEMDKALKLLNWDYIDTESKDKRTWFNNKDLSTFFEQDKFDTNKAQEFLEMEIRKIKKLL